MTDWQEAYYDLVNKVECECVQQGDLVPIWEQFKRMSLTIQKLQGHQGAMEAELAKFKALAETLAGALEEWDELIKHPYFGSREAMSGMNYAAQRGLKALRQWEEASDAG